MEKKLLIFLAVFSGLIQAGQERTYKIKTLDNKILELPERDFNKLAVVQSTKEAFGIDAFEEQQEIDLELKNIESSVLKKLLTLENFEKRFVYQWLGQFKNLQELLTILIHLNVLNIESDDLQFQFSENNPLFQYYGEKFFDNLQNQHPSSKKELLEFLEQYSEIKLKLIELFKKNNGEYFSIGQKQENVKSIYWNPQGTSYFVSSIYGSCQLFNADGQQVGQAHQSVSSIYWNPQGASYFALFNNNKAQLFTADGKETGQEHQNVKSIYWNPHGYTYFVLFKNNEAQLFTADGVKIGQEYKNVNLINWNPHGTSCLMRFYGDNIKLFIPGSQRVEKEHENVSSIYWNPQGTHYFVIFKNYIGQLFTAYGQGHGELLQNVLYDVSEVFWNPQGTHYFVIFNNGRGQLFNADGQQVGQEHQSVGSIYWNPKGASYFVRFRDNSVQLFNIDGQQVGQEHQSVSSIDWNPKGTSYFVRFINGNFQILTLNNEGLTRFVENCFWFSLNPQGTSYFVKFLDKTGQLYNKLTNDEIWERFIKPQFEDVITMRNRVQNIEKHQQFQQEEYTKKGMAGKALQTLKNWWNNEL